AHEVAGGVRVCGLGLLPPPRWNRSTGGLDPPAGETDLRALARLLAQAVESGAAVSFLSPFSVEGAEAWWRRTFSEARRAAVFLVARDGGGIVGTLPLHPAWGPNQPHRAARAQLPVGPHAPRRGPGA